MKHKTIKQYTTAAALLAGATWAMADASIYGKANVSFQIADENDETATEVVSNASRIGLKGSEELDGGLKAIYQFEFQVAVDDGDNGGETFSQRNIFVGLQGNMGTVKVGHFDTPFKSAQNKIDLFNDLEGDINNTITYNDNRESNTVSYSSPNGPVGVTVAYISSEDEDVDNGISAAVNFSTDDLYLAVAVDQNVEAEGTEAVRGIIQYTLGDLQLGGLVEQSDDGVETTDALLVSAQYKIDSWALKAQVGTSDIREEGGETFSLGADYTLAKSVKLFGYHTALESDQGTDNSYTGVGIEYKF